MCVYIPMYTGGIEVQKGNKGVRTANSKVLLVLSMA